MRRRARRFRWLLLAYPPRIRKRYGDEMHEVFRRSLDDAEAAGRPAWGVWARAFRDTAVSAPVLWARTALGGAGRHAGFMTRTREVGMRGLATDIRYALRGLRARPGFTAVALATLALGIGGNTAIFSIVDAAFIDALPYPDADRMVMLYNAPRPGTAFVGFSEVTLEPMEHSGAFAAVTAIAPTQVNVGGGDRPERVAAIRASAGVFDVVGTAPVVGRGFTRDEDGPSGGDVAVISHGLWQRRFGGEPGVVGRTLLVDDRPVEVVGVMPAGLSVFQDGVDLWMPLQIDPAALDATDAVNNNRVLVARLAEGVTMDEAARRATAALGFARERFPEAFREGAAVQLRTYRAWLVGDVRDTLLMLWGAVGLVLLIAAANLANLLLARAEERKGEVAVRVALGAPRGRVIRELLTESVLIALGGAVLGLAVAVGTIEALRPLAPSDVPLPDGGALDGTVLAFTAVVAVGTGLLFGFLPALSATAGDPRAALAEEGRGAGAGRSAVRNVLVVGEVALAAALLVGSGLLVRSLVRLQQVDPGFAAEGRVAASLSLPASRYSSQAEIEALLRPLAERLEAHPGVRGATFGQWIPLQGAVNWGFEAQDQPDADLRFADYNLVAPGYFGALDIPVVEGRDFTWEDMREDRPVVIVSRAFAEFVWPDGRAVGRHINVEIDGPEWREVVGVVGDVRNRSLASEPAGLMYFPPVPLPFSGPRFTHLIVEEASAGAASLSALREAVGGLDGSLPLDRVEPLSAVVTGSQDQRRFLLTLFGAFAAGALALAGVGLYGVVSFTLSLRTREIGLRMALGADARAIQGMVLRQTLTLAGVGLVLGLGAAAASGRLIASFLYGVTPRNAATFAAVAVFLGLVALVAAWQPARRATRIDPVESLRA